MNTTKNRRQNGRQSAAGFKFHNFVFNEGKQSFCLEEQDGNKKITVMHWKKTEQSSNTNGTSSRSEESFSESHNYLNNNTKNDCELPPNNSNTNSKDIKSSNIKNVPIIIDAEPEQTQPLDLSTKTTKRREMWSVDEILGLDTPTTSTRHLDLPSPATMMASMSCRSPDVKPFTSFFPSNPFHYGTPPPSPMIEAMLDDEIQRFLRSGGDIFSDQNNNFDSNIEEKLHSLRKELQDRRISSRISSNDFTKSHFKLKDSAFGHFDGRETPTNNRRTMSELDLKSSKSSKQLKRSYDDNSASMLFKTNKNDTMTTKLRQLRKFTRSYLDAHKSANESAWSSAGRQPAPEILKDDIREMQIESDNSSEQINKLWPGCSNTPTTSASSSTVQSSASASSVDGSV